MRKRLEYIGRTIPDLKSAIVLAVIYLATYIPDVTGYLKGDSDPTKYFIIREFLLMIFSCCYAFYRVCGFDPFYDDKYRTWLSLTPYDGKRPLPFGPIHLVETDFIWLALLTFLAYLNMPVPAVMMPILLTLPVICFMIVYIVLLSFSLHYREGLIGKIILFLVPFLIYPFRNPYFAIFLLFLFYLICYWSLRKSLETFQQRTALFADPLLILRINSMRHIRVTWPFNVLIPSRGSSRSLSKAFFISVLFTWWLHVLVWLTPEPFPWRAILGIFTVILGLGRLGTYIETHYPPISLRGRFATSRIIIPAYDKIFVAPICVILTGIVGPIILTRLGLSSAWSIKLSLFFVLLLVRGLGPDVGEWKLTAPCRIGRVRRVESEAKRRRVKSSSTGEKIQSKFKSNKKYFV